MPMTPSPTTSRRPRQRCAFRCRPCGRGAASSMAHRFSRDVREVADDGWELHRHIAACPGLWWQSAARNMPRAAQDGEAHGWHSSGLIAPPPACIWRQRAAPCAKRFARYLFELSVNPTGAVSTGAFTAMPAHAQLPQLFTGAGFLKRRLWPSTTLPVLRSELAQLRYVPRLVNIGSATDCYQPVERELKLTRSLIEVMQQARHPFRSSPSPAAWSATWIFWPSGRGSPPGGVCVTITTL